MKNSQNDIYKDLSDDPDFLSLSDKEKGKLVSIMERMLEMGIGAVYGVEEEGEPDADVNCTERIKYCKAVCCTFTFALTKEEVQKRHIKHNTQRPFFIARDDDKYCPHLNRNTFQCSIWVERPLRCRRYDCRCDPDIWPQGIYENKKN